MVRVPSSLLSTITSRLAVLVAFPVLGMVVLGAVVAVGQWQDRSAAQQLRRDAHIVQLLASLAVNLDAEADGIAAIQQAEALGFDLDQVLGADLSLEDTSGLSELFEQLAAQDPAWLADADATASVLEDWNNFRTYRSQPGVGSDGEFRDLRRRMAANVDRALQAQTAQLNLRFGRVDPDSDLIAYARSLQPGRDLLSASQAQRSALATYLLPLGEDGTDEERYRDLLAANAEYRRSLAALEEVLPEDYRPALDAVTADQRQARYRDLVDGAVAGEITPPEVGENLLALLPLGLLIFVDGLDSIGLLSDLDSSLTAEFVSGTERLEVEARDRLMRVVGLALALSAAVVTASIVTIRSITRPVRQLQHRARRITSGQLDPLEGCRREGPTDIALVHQALDDLTTSLRTVRAQAEALSAGRLDDDVLNHQVGGPLGASVHGSVARLRSMTARLEREATHDSLTGLPNRAAVMTILDRALTGPEARRRPLAAIMFDLDGFKQANDNMGHAVGDEVLCHVARRLTAQARGQFVARLGGDEFMILVLQPDGQDEVCAIASDAIASVSQPLQLSCGTFSVSACAGVVATGHDGWLPPSEILRRVDLALYEAKAESPGTVVRFDRALHDSLLASNQLAGELRLALSRNEFHLDAQPILELGSGSVVGYEALLRWRSPLRGLVPPGRFIGVAEQSELINQIDRWVIKHSAHLLAGWQREPTLAELTLSINVSARHLSRPELVTEIEEAIHRHDLRADRYIVEVTESQLIPNLDRAGDNLRRLKALGVRLAIDDFGTGYASVAHLRALEFDRLKIDRSFLQDLSDDTERSLASLLVSVGRDLDLEVVAEGIETDQQLRWARSAGCTHGQGYLFGRPRPVEAIPALTPARIHSGVAPAPSATP